jgi:hypothetical protein
VVAAPVEAAPEGRLGLSQLAGVVPGGQMWRQSHAARGKAGSPRACLPAVASSGSGQRPNGSQHTRGC